MKNLTTIGIDLAKNHIQIHGSDNQGKRLLKKRVTRQQFLVTMANLPKCVVGMEACGGSNYWASELIKLGHDVKIMSPQKVKKYTDHQKNDYHDAAACCEAVSRSQMRFVPIKNSTQVAMQSFHRVRSYYIQRRTALMNMTRGLLLEQGIAIPQGKSALIKRLIALHQDSLLSPEEGELFYQLKQDLLQLDEKIKDYTVKIQEFAKHNENCQRLQTISGIGPITATALIAKIGNGSEFKRGRELSAYLGLVPRQASSGDRQLLLGITKHGDRYIRQLLIHGGRSVVKQSKRVDKLTGEFVAQDKHSQWVRALTDRVGVNKASVAVANKNARLVIGVLKRQEDFDVELAH